MITSKVKCNKSYYFSLNKSINKLFMPALNRKVYLNSMKSVLVEQPILSTGESLDNDKDVT